VIRFLGVPVLKFGPIALAVDALQKGVLTIYLKKVTLEIFCFVYLAYHTTHTTRAERRAEEQHVICDSIFGSHLSSNSAPSHSLWTVLVAENKTNMALLR